VAAQLPPFWAERPAVWFAQDEAQFTLAGISSKKIKFYYVISQLDHRYTAEVEDITSPPERDPYTTLRTELVRRLSLSKEQRIRQLFTFKEMGDRKPSWFLLRHLRSLIPDVSDNLLYSIWSSQLPPNVQAILDGQPKGDLDAATRCAGRIIEAAPQPALASVAQLPESNALRQHVADLSRQVEALSAVNTIFALGLPAPAPGTAIRAADPPPEITLHPPSAGNTAATKPRHKSVHSPAPTASRKTNTADINGGTCLRYNTGRLFIMGRISKRRFLVDTGSDLCVYPRRLIPRRREQVN
jgi:hypothetical protein